MSQNNDKVEQKLQSTT